MRELIERIVENLSIDRKKIILFFSIVLFAIFAYIGYRLIYLSGISEYAKEFIAGCMGAVITIVATAALLKSQSDSEIQKEQITNIFIKKLELYNEFIELLNNVYKDRTISYLEIDQIIEETTKISLVCQSYVIRGIYQYIFQIMIFGHYEQFSEMPKKHKKEWKEWMKSEYYDIDSKLFNDEDFCENMFTTKSNIIYNLREDLWNRKISDLDENLSIIDIMKSLLRLRNENDLIKESVAIKVSKD